MPSLFVRWRVHTNLAMNVAYLQSSFARYMSGQGFETWVLEVRGAGLSVDESNTKDIEESAHAKSEQMEAVSNSATNGAFSAEKQSDSCPGAHAKSEQMEIEESACAKSEQMEAVSQSATNGAFSAEKQSNSFPGASVCETPVQNINNEISAAKGDLTSIPTVGDESKSVTRLTETFTQMSERLSGFLGEGQSSIMSANLLDQISKLFADSTLSERFNDISVKLSSLLETRQNSAIASQIRDLSQRLVNIIEEGQRSVSPPLFDLQERLSSTLEDFQKQLDLILKYDWDFDHYLEEDIPAVVR